AEHTPIALATRAGRRPERNWKRYPQKCAEHTPIALATRAGRRPERVEYRPTEDRSVWNTRDK
ncbi:MAG TPA: hypothetical protein PLN05_09625, partial [Pyrinomonadaceae bacterium]|nr:hypothetical protein [Pyrinomonadaceae bacterium]HRK50676.1 hypothetical protein [Pyrinomonadaceae bacterium]